MMLLNRSNRWLILAAGAAIQILTGIPAAWGIFRRPVMAEYNLSRADVSAVFSLTIAWFGVGCVFGGYLQDTKGPRAAGLWGTALLTFGMAAAGFVPRGAAGLFCLGFSLPVGLGTAFLYPAVMSCAQKWYRDKKGLATGFIGGAVGASGAFLTLFVRRVGGQAGIRACFWRLAGLSFAVCAAGSLLLQDPPPEAPLPSRQGRLYKRPPLDLPPARMLRTRDYWLCTASVALAAPAVLLFSPVIVSLGQQRGLSEGAAHLCVAVGSLGSAAGRLLMPMASDRLGRRRTDILLLWGLCGLSAAFAFARGGWVVVLGPMDGANLRACLHRAAVRWPAWQTWVVLPGARGLAAVFAAGFTLRRAGAVCGLPWAWLCNGRPVARRPGCEMALPLSEPGRIAARLEQGWVGADLRPGPAGENLLLYPAGPLL